MIENKSKREIIIIDPTVVSITEKRRVAAYCRVSSSSDEQLDSFAAQLGYYDKLIAEHDDWKLVDIYADEGISALGMKKRDEFNRLMKDAKKGKIDHIITKSISRFSRNTKDCLESVRALRELGVSIAFEKENINTAEMGGEMFLTMFSGAAQQESISISNNARIGCKMRMRNGTFIASSTPLGYKLIDRNLCVNEEQSKIVKTIFHSYLSGQGVQKIADRLNEAGIPTKSPEAKWCKNSILYILCNEHYFGDALLQKSYTTDALPFRRMLNNGEKERYYMESYNSPIILKEDFDKVQKLLTERKEKHGKARHMQSYPLSKHIYCSNCGTVFTRKISSGKPYWACRSHTVDKNKCSMPQIPEQELYKAFVRMYNKLRPATDQILGTMLQQLFSLRTSQNKSNVKIAELNKGIANLTEQNHVMNDLKVKNLIDSAFFIAQTNELSHKIRKLRIEKSRLIESEDDDELLTGTRNLLDFFKDSSEVITEFDADAFEQMVNKIIVDSNEVIRFRLMNGLELTEKIERTVR